MTGLTTSLYTITKDIEVIDMIADLNKNPYEVMYLQSFVIVIRALQEAMKSGVEVNLLTISLKDLINIMEK